MENTQICIISSQNSYENNEKNIIESIKDEYTNNMIDLKTINETNNNLIEPIIEFKSNYLKSVQEGSPHSHACFVYYTIPAETFQEPYEYIPKH